MRQIFTAVPGMVTSTDAVGTFASPQLRQLNQSLSTKPVHKPAAPFGQITVALPDMSAAIEEQVPFVTLLMVYVVVTTGLTFTVMAGAVPLKVVPSDNVPDIVPGPVKFIVNVPLPPLHITCYQL